MVKWRAGATGERVLLLIHNHHPILLECRLSLAYDLGIGSCGTQIESRRKLLEHRTDASGSIVSRDRLESSLGVSRKQLGLLGTEDALL